MCFTLKLAGVFYGEEGVFLNSNSNIQVFVQGAIDGAHPPLSKDILNAIAIVE